MRLIGIVLCGLSLTGCAGYVNLECGGAIKAKDTHSIAKEDTCKAALHAGKR